MNKPFIFIFSIIIGAASSITPPVLLNYGIGQFHIIQIVGHNNATWWFSITTGLVSIFLLFFKPLLGCIFDKNRYLYPFARPLGILIGSLFGFISMVSLAYTNNIILLIVFWLLSSISYGLVSLIYFTLIPELFKKNNFGRISGVIGGGIPIVIMIISVTVMGFFSLLPVNDKIILTALIQLILNLIITYFNCMDLKISSEQKFKNNQLYKRYIYPSFKDYPNFTWTLLSRICVHLVVSGLSMMTLFYISRFNLHEEEIFKINAITSIGTLLMVMAGIYFGCLSDKINNRKIFIIISSISISICMLLYPTYDSVIFIIFTSFIYQLFFGMFNSVDLALVNQVLPTKENYAKDIAIMNSTNHISQSLISFFTPTILAWGSTLMNDDGYTLFFMVLAFFSCLSAIFIIQVKEK